MKKRQYIRHLNGCLAFSCKRMYMLILALALLLSGCQVPVNDPVETSTQAETETTAAPVETTVPEETTVPDTLFIKDCLLDDRQPLSYEALFDEDQLYADNDLGYAWLYPYEDTQILCGINRDENGSIIVESEAFDEVYTVPCKQDLSNYSLLAADGKFVYLRDQASTTVIQIELRTGEVKELVTAEKLLQTYICGREILYYAAVEGEKITINRLYIPTMQNDCLYDQISADIPLDAVGFYLYAPTSTLGCIVWETMAPEMMALLKKELSNPDSPYRTQEHIAHLWEKEDPLDDGRDMIWLTELLQEDYGVRSRIECTYDINNGTLSQRKGIVDSCWTGTVWGHDHFAPEYTTVADPVLNIGDWEYLADKKPTNAGVDSYADIEGEIEYEAVLYSDRFGPGQLYLKKDGKVTLLSDKTFTDICRTKHYIYGITSDNTLLKINWETGKTIVLYTAKNGKIDNMVFTEGYLYFTDGDQLIEAHIPMWRYRVLLEHPHISFVGFHFEGHMTFYLRRGLAERAFNYCPITESLMEDTPRP